MRPPRSRFPAPSRSCARSSRGPRRVPSVEEELARRLASGEEVVLPRKPRFIGLVGSRRHTGHHLEALRAKGVPEEVIGRIQSPVGLDIGARTAQEIALSILAGLVAIRRGGPGVWKSRNG